ncbi:hypothetical protein [Streptomyces sp. NBC_01483]|uniref:hypothetical protein n=1 Tax=Streptomyces sp. NBC_01483 TaxID=2903883 RepID=UPI002E377C2B|nr:hypothetical protein [Streptomyces sp. NBC_01483]
MSTIKGKLHGYRAQILGQRTATGSSWSLWVEKTGTEMEPVLDDDGNPVLDDNGEPKTRPAARTGHCTRCGHSP